MTELNPGNINRIIRDCMFFDDEVDKDGRPLIEAVYVDGIVNRYGFHPHRLHSYAREVRTMLTQLPDEFYAAIGGGWSFLNLCMKTDHSMWTSLHQDCERFAALAIGLGLGEWTPARREQWKMMPGGVPYFVVRLERAELND